MSKSQSICAESITRKELQDLHIRCFHFANAVDLPEEARRHARLHKALLDLRESLAQLDEVIASITLKEDGWIGMKEGYYSGGEAYLHGGRE